MPEYNTIRTPQRGNPQETRTRTYNPDSHQLVPKQSVQIFLKDVQGNWLKLDSDEGFIIADRPTLYRGTHPVAGFMKGDLLQNTFGNQSYEVVDRNYVVSFSRITPMRLIYILQEKKSVKTSAKDTEINQD